MPSSNFQSNILGFAEFAIRISVIGVMTSYVFKIQWIRAVQAWLPTLFAIPIIFALNYFVINPNFYEKFRIPLNGMAPTLLADHWKGICSDCGNPNYCSPQDPLSILDEFPLMICDNFHVTRPSFVDSKVHVGDSFLVSKYLTPKRWDLIIFQYPKDPTKLFVKRLVGLPGETIQIKDGSLWINGELQTPPDSIKGIKYYYNFKNLSDSEFLGSEQYPAKLGINEYFVLGDFSYFSFDSRLWNQGASGQNSFAVPQSYVKGIVTHTTWPPYRLRIHR